MHEAGGERGAGARQVRTRVRLLQLQHVPAARRELLPRVQAAHTLRHQGVRLKIEKNAQVFVFRFQFILISFVFKLFFNLICVRHQDICLKFQDVRLFKLYS